MAFDRAPENRAEAREHFSHTLTPDQRLTNPLYAGLCDATQRDNTLVDLLLEAPPAQRRPVLILAAIHLLALSDPEVGLGDHYPSAAWLKTVGGVDGEPREPPSTGHVPDGDGVAHVLRAVTRARDQIAHTLATRSTQTNEVGRSGVLAVGQVAASGGAPFGLIDLGCSAGLNLVPDSYRIDLPTRVLGSPQSPVVITPSWRSDPAAAGELAIAWRCGIEPQPIDPGTDSDALWLLACQWPDDLARFERTRRAMRLWRHLPEVPPIIHGSALSSLHAAVERAPEDLPLVIQHSWMAAYLSSDEQEHLAREIRAIGSRRKVTWLWLEHAREVPGFEPPRPRHARIRGSSLLVAEEIGRRPMVLAQCHPHGTWASWDDES